VRIRGPRLLDILKDSKILIQNRIPTRPVQEPAVSELVLISHKKFREDRTQEKGVKVCYANLKRNNHADCEPVEGPGTDTYMLMTLDEGAEHTNCWFDCSPPGSCFIAAGKTDSFESILLVSVVNRFF
jgi:hypothetical protein